MEIEYNLPTPNLRYRRQKYREDLQSGDIVTYYRAGWNGYNYSRNPRIGVMVVCDSDSFLIAGNWDGCGNVWTNDVISPEIELYEPNEIEKSWGLRALFKYQYVYDEDNSGIEAVKRFVEHAFPKDSSVSWPQQEYCRNMSAELPWCVNNIDWAKAKKELWGIAYKEILNTGLQFNRYRVECFCFLIGVLMIADKAKDDYECKQLLRSYRRNWGHFVWMYAMVIGRLMGTELKNFTGVVHQFDNNYRKPYLHLYMPLVESNIDKICRYNPSENRYKLEAAIKKMQKVEALEIKNTDLDELYSILFPKHFQQTMAENRPAATIADLQEKLAEKDKTIVELNNKLTASIDEFDKQREKMYADFVALANASVTFDEIETGLLRLSRPMAEDVLARMSMALVTNERFMAEYPKLLEKVQLNDRATYQISAQPGSTVNAGCEIKNPEFKVLQNTNEQQKSLENKNDGEDERREE